MSKAADFSNARWHKSNISDTTGCVEVAYVDGTIGLRDTKDAGAGPIHRFTEKEWNAFLTGVANGEFTIDSLAG